MVMERQIRLALFFLNTTIMVNIKMSILIGEAIENFGKFDTKNSKF